MGRWLQILPKLKSILYIFIFFRLLIFKEVYFMASYYTTIDKLDERVNQIDGLLSENLMSIATLSNGIDLE